MEQLQNKFTLNDYLQNILQNNHFSVYFNRYFKLSLRLINTKYKE